MGAQLSAVAESFPAKSQFSVNDIPDLSGKIMIVTGANTGIGKETAKALLAHNAKVYIAARNKEKSLEAINDLERETGRKAIFLQLDLGNLPSIKSAAEEFLRQEKKLHVLFNNAGVMHPPVGSLTAQGYDMQFGTNVLGHIYFTKLLLPALLAGAKSSADGKARVVNTSSGAHHFFPTLDFNTFKGGAKKKKLSNNQLYGQSKSGNIIFSNELNRRYASEGIVSTSLNPGNIRSDLQRHMPPLVARFVRWAVLYPTPYGALTQLWAGTSVEGAHLGGKYLGPWARERIVNAGTQDPKLGKELWDWAEEQVKDL